MKRKLFTSTALILFLCLFSKAQTGSVVVLIDSVQSAANTQTTVNIRVKNFVNIIGIQGSITFNPAVAAFSSVTYYGLNGMNNNNFGLTQVSNGILAFSWTDNNLTGNTLADSSVLFSIKFNIIGSSGQFSPVNLSNSPTSVEFTNSSFNTIPVIIKNGNIKVISNSGINNITLMADSVSGNNGSNILLPIRVKNFNQILSLQGTINFDPNIAVFSGIQQILLPGMTISDFGTNLVNTGKLTFSWNSQSSNSVSLADSSVIFILRFTLTGNNGQNCQVSFGNNPLTLECINSALNNVGIVTKSGNISINTLPSAGNLLLKIDTVSGVNGGIAIVPVRVWNFSYILSIQGSIIFDTSVVSFLNIQNFGLVGMDTGNFGTGGAAAGKLSFLWYDGALTGQTLSDSTVLFSMAFNIKGIQGSSTTIAFNNTPTPLEAVNNNFVSVPLTYSNGKISVLGNVNLTVSIQDTVLCQGQSPNVNIYVSTNLGVGNVFTVQLSDKFGSFTNPVNIGSINAISSTNVNVTIPTNIPYGNGYKIRVLSSVPNIIGSPNTSNLTINPAPSKPTTPTGTTTLCVNSPNTIYTTTGSTGATTYQWSIYPTTAGTITGTSTSGTVDWNNTYTGTAKISVIGINSCGNSTSSDSLTITINPAPSKPATPTGTTTLCVNSPNTVYTTTGSTGATTYQWSIYPTTAGTITGTSTSGTVDWNNTYTGTAKISVIGINSCGNSTSSDSLTITINPAPSKPATPTGTTTLCVNSPNTVYTTTGSTGATTYQWSIYPTTAGTITGPSTTGTVDWNNTYTGTAKISVIGINTCGNSTSSDSLTVTINPAPSKPATPTGTTTLCENSPNTIYTTTGSTGATTYQWSIYPTTAGTITGTSTSGTVDWNNTYTGTAKISVIGINSCGSSASSDSLTVTINSAPSKPATPTGTTTLCVNSPNTVYTTTGSAGATTYQWSIYPPTAGTITGTSTSGTVDWNNTYTGTAKISVIGINTCGSSISSDSLTVAINPLPSASIINEIDSICPLTNDTLKIILNGNSPFNLTYFEGTAVNSITNILSNNYNLVVTPLLTTTYKLISVTDALCSNSLNDSAKVILRELPVADFSYTTNGMEAHFTNLSKFSDTYIWNFGDNSSISYLTNPIHTYLNVGNYLTTLKAINQCGNDTYQDTVKIDNTGVFGNNNDISIKLFPNPNRGIFKIDINNIQGYCFVQIFNYSGIKVFQEKFGSFEALKLKTFSLLDFPKGIYLIKLSFEDRIISDKLIIE